MPLPALVLPAIAAGAPLLMRWLSVAFFVGMIAKIIAALGLAYFVFTGVDTGLDALNNQVQDHLSGVPAATKAILDTAGVTTVISWMVNAYIFRIYITVSKFTLYRKKGFLT